MNVALLSDLHVRQVRLDGEWGHRALLADVHRRIEAEAPDLILIAGDISGWTVPWRVPAAERNALVEFLLQLAALCPVVMVRGNHSLVGEWDFLNHLAAEHPIYFCDEPELIEIPGHSAVLCLPWLDRSRYGRDDNWAQCVRAEYQAAIGSFRDDLLRLRKTGIPVFLMAHAAVKNATLHEGGQPFVPTADPVVLLEDVYDDRYFEAAFFGHYHCHQRLGSKKFRAWYVGSLFCNTFGEEAVKGFCLYDTQTHKLRFERLPQPARFTLSYDFVRCKITEVCPDPKGLLPFSAPCTVQTAVGALIANSALAAHYFKIEATVPERATDDALDALRTLEEGLAETVLSVQQQYTVERAERLREGAQEVAEYTTLTQQLAEFAKHVDPSPKRVVVRRACELTEDLA